MALRSGLAGQLGVAAETTYGTFVAPNKFYEPQQADLKDASQWIQGGGLAAGRFMRLGSRRVRTTYGAAGTIQMEVTNKYMGTLLQALMGTTVTPTMQNTSTGYLQTHTLADPFGKSLTIQTGIPDLTGTVRPYNFLGSKVISAQFQCNIGETLMSTWTIDSQYMEETDGLVAASYPTTLSPYNFTQSTIKTGTFGSELATTGIKGMQLTIERAQKTDRLYHGSTAKKSEPVLNDWQNISGSFDVDFMNKADFADRFHAGSLFSLVWEFTGASLGGTPVISETFRITLPQVYLTGDTPTLDGPDVVSGSFPFTAASDGTNLPKIEYISTDVTL